MDNSIDSLGGLTRREIVALAGGAGAAFLLGCAGSGGAKTATAASATTSGTGSEGCTVTPEGEIGPYFADDSATGFNRSNIVTNIDGSDTQPGVPLTLTLYVYDAENSCKAYEGVQVDIWHCNASGTYSDISSEGTSSDNYLRGYQVTDSTGKVVFKTIIPGWYSGRTAHIHLKLRSKYDESGSTSDGENTTQLFFPQSMINNLYENVSPYNSRGDEDTSNAADHVYTGETKGETLLSLTGDATNGYAATFAIYLPITALS